MKWKNGFVLVLVIVAALSGVESVSAGMSHGMMSDWEHELWSTVTYLSVSDDGHVAAIVSTPGVSDVYLFDKEGNLLWDREFDGASIDRVEISRNGELVVAISETLYFIDKTGKVYKPDLAYLFSPFHGLSIAPNGEYVAVRTQTGWPVEEAHYELFNSKGKRLWVYDFISVSYYPRETEVSSNGEVLLGIVEGKRQEAEAIHFLKDGRRMWRYEIKGYEDFTDVAISPNGDYVILSVSGVKGDSIHTLDKSGNLINKKIVDAAPFIHSVSLEGTYKIFSEDRIEIYNINNTLIEEEYIVKIPDAVFVLSPNAKYAATASGKNVYFYDISKLTLAKEIWNNAIRAASNVTSVRYDVDLTLTTEKGAIKDITHVEVDFEQRKSHTIHTGDIHMESYVIGNEMYTCTNGKCEKSDMVFQWDKESKLEELLGCGENADIKLVESEKLDGKDCWILEVIPLDSLEGFEIEIKDWISKEDYLPQRAVIYTKGEKIAIDRTVVFYDYNKPLTITLPVEAVSTPTPSGFEAIFAVAGMIGVAYLLMRRKGRHFRG
jgi:hypothetical protein